MEPSKPGYHLSTADLQRAYIGPDILGRIIQQAGQHPDTTALLAGILKSQRKNNARFRPAMFNFPAYNRQLLFTENPNRSYLIIQNVGAGDLIVLFEDGPVSIEDDSGSADAQQMLINAQTRGLRIVAGGYFEPLVPPVNSITIFTLNTETNGVAIEGQ